MDSIAIVLIAEEYERQVNEAGSLREVSDDPIWNLVKSAALIAAEIDRLFGEKPGSTDDEFEPFSGPECPRRCTLCSDHSPIYAKEHHWMYENEKEDGEIVEEGFLKCRHCDATREIPMCDEFWDAFGL